MSAWAGTHAPRQGLELPGAPSRDEPELPAGRARGARQGRSAACFHIASPGQAVTAGRRRAKKRQPGASPRSAPCSGRGGPSRRGPAKGPGDFVPPITSAAWAGRPGQPGWTGAPGCYSKPTALQRSRPRGHITLPAGKRLRHKSPSCYRSHGRKLPTRRSRFARWLPWKCHTGVERETESRAFCVKGRAGSLSVTLLLLSGRVGRAPGPGLCLAETLGSCLPSLGLF